MNTTYLPGLGDAETWPTYYGHPNDPRAGDEDLEELTEVEEWYQFLTGEDKCMQ